MGDIINSKGISYPKITDLKTGKDLEFPIGDLARVDKEDRVAWFINKAEADKYRSNYADGEILCKADFIKKWYDKDFETPPNDWKDYDIHHIKPKEFGGSNSFENLTPILRTEHQSIVTPWWNAYR